MSADNDVNKRLENLERIVIGEIDEEEKEENLKELRHLERRKRYSTEFFTSADDARLSKVKEECKKYGS